jgi:hypothetical protein
VGPLVSHVLQLVGIISDSKHRYQLVSGHLGCGTQPCVLLLFAVVGCAGSADNTRAALHFATAAARVVMRPQLNRVASSKAVIKAMASEIQQLKAKLVSVLRVRWPLGAIACCNMPAHQWPGVLQPATPLALLGCWPHAVLL